jgi:hypothetical protein
VRLTGASGALPLTPFDQVELLFLLTRDSDEEVARTAQRSLLGVSPSALATVLKDPTVPADALAFLGEHTDSDEVQQAVIRNPTTPDETVRLMVPKLSETNLEFIVVNQTRLLRHTPIIDALERNENLNSDQLRRVRELKHDFKIGVVPRRRRPRLRRRRSSIWGRVRRREEPPRSRGGGGGALRLEGPHGRRAEPGEEEEKKSLFAEIATAARRRR